MTPRLQDRIPSDTSKALAKIKAHNTRTGLTASWCGSAGLYMSLLPPRLTGTRTELQPTVGVVREYGMLRGSPDGQCRESLERRGL